MAVPRSAKTAEESTQRIEPTHLSSLPAALGDLVAELSASAATLGQSLHPRTAANLADLVRIMNAYYSNLIEGHNTRPLEIERALAGEFDSDRERRDLQLEAAAHVRVQRDIDRTFLEGSTSEPASEEFIRFLHREFYRDAPESMLAVRASDPTYRMTPGAYRTGAVDDVVVGRHQPPSSDRVSVFMAYFSQQYRVAEARMGTRILDMALSHHRLNYIHPFPDGNGRVSRLMSHAMAHAAGIGAHGLWSISRGLARGLDSRTEYKTMMDRADTPRENDRDGRGNLSERTTIEFAEWFLRVCIDQVQFMSSLFDLETLASRLRDLVAEDRTLNSEATRLLEEALIRGEISRGDVARITGLPLRSAQRVLHDVIQRGLLASDTPKGPVSLRFPAKDAELLFPRLFPRT